MFRGRPFSAVVFAALIAAGITACGPGQAAGAVPRTSHLKAVVLAHQEPTLPSCSRIKNLRGWSGVYSACAGLNGTFLQVINTSVWGVLSFEVPQGVALPLMTVSMPQTGSELLNLAERVEIPGANGGWYVGSSALVPPGSTLSVRSLDGPVRLFIGVNYLDTSVSAAAEGLVDAIKNYLAPTLSDAESAVACAESVARLPQINQWLPNSPEFWNSFDEVAVKAAACSDAFRSWSEAIGVGDRTIIADAEHESTGFWDDLLPRLVSLVSDDLAHVDL
jgi:hypothetical protein